MGAIRIPEKVRLLAGLLSRDAGLFTVAKKRLEDMFGKIDYESEILDFYHTEYYDKEMGSNLKRIFFSFGMPYDPATIYDTKLKTNMLEQDFLDHGKRTLNIDPGYLNLSKLVLLSTKDYTHRIYLDKGIFAEVTLHYKDKSFQAWPWTYPDYKSKPYIDIFNLLREKYKCDAQKVQ